MKKLTANKLWRDAATLIVAAKNELVVPTRPVNRQRNIFETGRSDKQVATADPDFNMLVLQRHSKSSFMVFNVFMIS